MGYKTRRNHSLAGEDFMSEKITAKRVLNATKWSTFAEIMAKLATPIVNMVLARLYARGVRSRRGDYHNHEFCRHIYRCGVSAVYNTARIRIRRRTGQGYERCVLV